ncbi:FGGY family carbohydrate kinase [Actinoplanes aureus]|uniref:Glycerol kinase GlpK n=1 Tax=Actinoplanes aureus TaxID=2792083 RepID=A0A931FUW7_9ACTN|nr:glycerol kinase GlpK [Actinoplanes aureus]MBG0560217.1 glycerol kinase GlpK [Actinoplanes aureus]
MSELIGSLYLTGTGVRFIVYDAAGVQVARHETGYGRSSPEPDRTEYDPGEIWQAAQASVTAALAGPAVSAADLAALGIANQRDTTVVWNRRTGQPYHPAIGGFDRRSGGHIVALGDQAAIIRKKTGLTPDALFAAGKIKWILDNVAGARADAEAGEALFGTLDSWLIWNLTGGTAGGRHVTDVTNASRTMLMSLDTEDWDEELLALFGVPPAMLPEILPSSAQGAFGATTASGPFGAEVPIGAVLAGKQAGLVGQQCFRRGQARYNCEASSTLLLNTGTARADAGENVLTTVAYRFGIEPTTYALEALVPFTGATIQWLVDGLGIIRGVGEVEAMARRADDPEGMYFVPAFTGLTLPRRDPGARGAMVGFEPWHSQNHVARATLHALAYQARDLLQSIQESSGAVARQVRVDGHGAWFDMCMQIHADILGIGLSRPADVADVGALGAAYAAGLAAGIWQSVDEIAATRRENHRWSPQWMEDQRQRGHAGWLRAIERCNGWAGTEATPTGDHWATLTGAEWRADGSR